MRAKDTVTHLDDIDNGRMPDSYASQRKALEKQAEISFKAGIKEVVEWIKTNSKDALMRDSSPQMFMTGFAKWEWQAKVKEWGF